MGSLNVAEPGGREFSLRSMSADVMRKIRTAGDGTAVAYLVEETLSLARCSWTVQIICESHYQTSVLWSRTLIQNESDPMPALPDLKSPVEPEEW
jgi:hypothetical protein